MIRDTAPDQMGLFAPEAFQTPFSAGLDPDNRWVVWARQIPWAELAAVYQHSLKAGGRPAKPARLVIGALIIKHRLGLSDTETIAQLRENPYLQYFCGFERFVHEAAAAPTLFVKFRERLTPAPFAAFEQAVIDQMTAIERVPRSGSSDSTRADDDDAQPPQDGKRSTNPTLSISGPFHDPASYPIQGVDEHVAGQAAILGAASGIDCRRTDHNQSLCRAQRSVGGLVVLLA